MCKFREHFVSNHERGNGTSVAHQVSVQSGNRTHHRETTSTSPHRVRPQGQGDEKSWFTNRLV